MKFFTIQFAIIILISLLINSNETLNSIPKYLNTNIIEDVKNLLFILPEEKTITFNDSQINITLYNTSAESFSYDKMNINFENCLTILQKIYDLDPFFDYSNNDNDELYKRCFFIIIKIEIDRKYSQKVNLNNTTHKYPTNHIEYLIFTIYDRQIASYSISMD